MKQSLETNANSMPSVWFSTRRQFPWWFPSTGTELDLIVLAIFVPIASVMTYFPRRSGRSTSWDDYCGHLRCELTADSVTFWTAKPAIFRRVRDRLILTRPKSSLVAIEMNDDDPTVVTFRFDTGFLAVLHLNDRQTALDAIRAELSK